MSGIMSMLLGAVSSAAAAADEFFNRVTLLLNTGSTNGAQNNTFLDSSSNTFTITRNGNTTQGTFTPFSQTGWSNYFDGSSYLNVGTSGQSDFNFPAPSGSTNNFCIELWFYATGTLSATTYTALVGCHDGVDSSSWSTFVRSNGVFIYGSTNTFTGGGTVNSNAWNHAVFVRSADNVSVYLNGSRVDTQTRSGAYNNTSDLLHIGDDNSGTNPPFTGYISNVRILKGSSAAIYSGTTITVPTSPLTAVTGTVLLSSQSNRFVDNSSVASSITVGAGTPSVQAFSPFAPTAAYSTTAVGGSGYFDGTGDSLSATGASLNPNGTDYTIEGWFYAGSSGSTQVIYEAGTGAAGDLNIFLLSGQIAFSVSGTGSTGVNYLINSWNYFACVKSGVTFYIYLNGVRTTSLASGTANSKTTINIGARSGGTVPFTGYLCNLRISNTAVYTGTTNSIPTSPLTTTANTQLLLNYTNAGIYDAAAKNDLETVGNAQVSTTQAKFGTTSMSFDGTGDYLRIPSSPITSLGSGDWTIEFWLYRSGSGNQIIYDQRNTATQVAATIFNDGTNVLRFFVNGVNRISDTGTFPSATWTHVAVSKSGSSTRMFVNGTQVGSTYTDTNTYLNNPIFIGAQYDGASGVNGYIDDLRVSLYARYAANFTAPTAAFPVQ